MSTASPAVAPDRETFRRLAREYRVVPVWRTLLADLTTPVAAFVRLCGDDEHGGSGFLLESVDHGGAWGRWSFVGRSPRAKLVARDATVSVSGDLPGELVSSDGVLATLERLLEWYRSPVAAEFGEAGSDTAAVALRGGRLPRLRRRS
ncbi:MAG: hypothetical protein V9E94_13260 [Microthrixaceae bacterium]